MSSTTFYYPLFAAALLLTSCNDPKPAKVEVVTPTKMEAPTPASVETKEALRSADAERNTNQDTLLMADGSVLRLQLAQAGDWAKAAPNPLPATPDSLETRALTPTGGRVVREGIELRFKAAKEPAVVLRNDTSDTESAVGYSYWGSLPAAHQWVVFATFYESSGVVLIDQRTGRRTDTWGRPLVSADGSYILTYNADLEAAFDPTGMQLFRIGAAGPKLVWQRALAHWGPADMRWLSQNQVVVKQDFGITEDGTRKAPRYVKLTLPLPQ
jgi:hypothetical protein